MNWPDERGEKLSKLEALAWTYLFAVEDIHIFAERYSIRKTGQRLESTRLAAFRERVADLMYLYAVQPDLSESDAQVRARRQLIHECFDALGMQREREAEVIFGDHLSDSLLSRWYDTFLPYFDALDADGMGRLGHSFSRMGLNDLHALEARTFLPTTRPPFDWQFAGEPVRPSDRWLGILRYDEMRQLWLIADVMPPE